MDRALLIRLYTLPTTDLSDLLDSLSKDPIESAPTTLFDLTEWALSEEIRPLIEVREAQFAAPLKRKHLANLDTLAFDSPNPADRRRASTTILRFLTSPGGTPLRGVRNSPSSPTRGGGGGGPALQAGGGSTPTSSTPSPPHPFTDSPTHPFTPPLPQEPPTHTPESTPSPSPLHPLTCSPAPSPPHSPLPTPHSPLSFPSSPALDAARLAFLAGKPNPSEDDPHLPPLAQAPSPIFTPNDVLRTVTSFLALKSIPRKTRLMVAFNFSGIEDRSRACFKAFCENFVDRYPKLLISTGLSIGIDNRPGEHSYTIDTKVAYPNFEHNRFPFRATFHRPTDGPLKHCWLISFGPDPFYQRPNTS